MRRLAVLRDPRPRRFLVLVLCCSLVLPPSALGQPPATCTGGPLPTPPVDNRDGYFVNLEEAPVRPLAFGSDGHALYALNLPDARVVKFDVTNPLAPQQVAEVGVGLGPVAIVLRPAQGAAPRELWVACQSSNAVFVIDEPTLRVKDSVRLKGEPTGIAFDAAGQFAYVTMAAVDRIAKVKASDPHNPLDGVAFLEFESETRPGSGQTAHVPEPRALLVDDDDLFALSFQSGNSSFGTELNVVTMPIADGWQANAAFPSLVPVPPDRDVLRFDLASSTPAGVNALWRMGTLNFDLARGGPQDHLYVSTVDFNNITLDLDPSDPKIALVGEAEYRKKGFAVHAVSHAAPGTGATNPAPARIDLNVDVDPALLAANPGYRCAVPNQMAISADGARLFVACYETRNVAVVDLSTDRVIAELAGGTAATDPFGPRGLALAGNVLYLHQRGSHQLQVFDLTSLTPGTVRGPVAGATRAIGYDPTPPKVLAGRRHFLNAANSGSGLATCNTCHMDGHLDGIAWDLSDSTGFDDAVPRTPKGTKVTMSLRGIEETPPFHWRGDRADLSAFNPAFAGLLGGSTLGKPELAEFEAFVFSLSYPANPHLADDRVYSDPARAGFDCFASHPTTHTVSKDTDGVAGQAGGQIQVSCAACHAMDGSSGTLNQVNNPAIFLLADDATQLRGLFDKESDPVTYVTNPSFPSLATLPASGWGFANTGFTDSIADFVGLGVFSFPPSVPAAKANVTQFLLELDTGIAPAAAFAYTVTASAAAEEGLLTAADDANDADLILRGWIRTSPTVIVPLGGQWDTATQAFLTDRTAVGALTLTDLHTKTQAGDGVFTLIGTPVGSGHRLGLDRDMDFRLDGDEGLVPATSTANPDSDGDKFPDGYETRLGSDPTLASSTPSDAVKPVITASAVTWRNSNVFKVRWRTDEESKSRLQLSRLPAVVGQPIALLGEIQEIQFKQEHAMVVRGLLPGSTYRATLIAEDPSGNTSRKTLPDQTMQSHLFASTHVARTQLVRNGPGATPGTQNYTATITLVGPNGESAGSGLSVELKLVEWPNGTCASGCNTETTLTPAATSNSAGVVTATFDGTRAPFSNGTAEVFVTKVTDPGKRLYFHPLDGQFGHWARTAVP